MGERQGEGRQEEEGKGEKDRNGEINKHRNGKRQDEMSQTSRNSVGVAGARTSLFTTMS